MSVYIIYGKLGMAVGCIWYKGPHTGGQSRQLEQVRMRLDCIWLVLHHHLDSSLGSEPCKMVLVLSHCSQSSTGTLVLETSYVLSSHQPFLTLEARACLFVWLMSDWLRALVSTTVCTRLIVFWTWKWLGKYKVVPQPDSLYLKHTVTTPDQVASVNLGFLSGWKLDGFEALNCVSMCLTIHLICYL